MQPSVRYIDIVANDPGSASWQLPDR